MTGVKRVILHEKFQVGELALRWRKARVSALSSVMGAELSVSDPYSEYELLIKIHDADRERALRAVFDYSRKLGLSLTKFLGLSWELDDLAEILPHLQLGCFSGTWNQKNGARVLERSGACESLSASGSFGCDYWREALDGFVMGVGENERFTRHRSRGHQDDHCLDILFTESFEMPRVVSAEKLPLEISHKFGLISDEIKEKLSPLVSRLQGMKVGVQLKGLSEGILYYELNPEEGVLCGAGGKFIHESFEKEAKTILPGIHVKDVAPLAVYGGGT